MAQRTLRQASQPPKAVQAIKSTLAASKIFLKADATIILACGKRPNPTSPGGRDRILEYAINHLKKFQFFIAEDVFDPFCVNEIDLLSLEENMSRYCDCVIIILESESTYAELGAFAMKTELVKKLLVINDINFEKSQSFISLGPLSKVNKESLFQPVIHANLHSILRAVPELSKRLSKLKRQYNKKVVLSHANNFQEAPPKIRMLFLLDLITFFQPVKYKEIIRILTTYYGNQKFEVNLDIHMLNALGLTKRIDEYYLRPPDNQRLFFAYSSLNEISVRADVINHYHKYSKERVSILKQR